MYFSEHNVSKPKPGPPRQNLLIGLRDENNLNTFRESCLPIIFSRKETNDSYDQKLPIITFTSLFEPAEADRSLRVIDESEKRKRCPGLMFLQCMSGRIGRMFSKRGNVKC